MVTNGSSHSQIGPTRADTAATPTHPYTHRNSVATAASDEPPAMPWAMIQTQPTSPTARSTRRRTAGTRTMRPGGAAAARMSRARTNTNDNATVAAAPAR